MRIILHGFGAFPAIFWHMINYAKKNHTEAQWAIILTSDHYEAEFIALLGRENVMVLKSNEQGGISAEYQQPYPGHLFRDIDTEKRTFKHAKSAVQFNRAMAIYRQMRHFMNRFGPTHALVSQVEGFDGKAFIAAAHELSAEIVVPTSCRNIGGIFFSPNAQESIPSYANMNSSGAMDRAAEFLERFRDVPNPARFAANAGNDVILESFQKPFMVRILNTMRRWTSSSGQFEWDYLRASVLNNLPVLRDVWWGARRRKNQRYCDIDSLNQLPDKFIFYPLQYSPESSINTPAPYFVDQMRAIDAIRHSMQSDCRLVVKEHPACILIRNGSFVKRLQHTSGVVVAHYTLPGLEIVKKAGLTISVTGTATLEAFLLGRSAITLGSSLVSASLGGVCPIDALPDRIATTLNCTISDNEILSFLARLFDVHHNVIWGSPGIPGEPVLREGNIVRFANGFFNHCHRIQEKAVC